MNKITNQQKWDKIEQIERGRIFGFYHLEELNKEIRKGNETINVLFQLLKQEVNKHNGTIKKQITKLRNTPTID